MVGGAVVCITAGGARTKLGKKPRRNREKQPSEEVPPSTLVTRTIASRISAHCALRKVMAIISQTRPNYAKKMETNNLWSTLGPHDQNVTKMHLDAFLRMQLMICKGFYQAFICRD